MDMLINGQGQVEGWGSRYWRDNGPIQVEAFEARMMYVDYQRGRSSVVVWVTPYDIPHEGRKWPVSLNDWMALQGKLANGITPRLRWVPVKRGTAKFLSPEAL